MRALSAVVAGALCAGMTLAGAGVADAATTATQIAPAMSRPTQTVGETFFDKTFTQSYAPGAKETLAGSEDGTEQFAVDDLIDMTVTHPDGTTSNFHHSFDGDCGAPFEFLGPTDVSNLFAAGNNTVRVKFQDECGVNDANTDLWLVSDDQAATPASIAPTSGNAQSAPAGTAFPAPLVATVTDTAGGPSADTPVTFTITAGSATFPGGATSAPATTGNDGRATSPTLTAGTTPGPVTVTAATPGVTSPATVTAVSGSGQSTAVGTPFPKPLVAAVTDTTGKPSVGTVVTFTVTGGSATFPGGAISAPAKTGNDGRATSPTLTAGPNPGTVTINATAPGATGTATYTETVTTTSVRGAGVFTYCGQRYSISVDTRTTGPHSATGGLTIAGGDKNTTARSATITSVTKTKPGTAVVTGTAVTSAGQTVPFRLTVTDGAGGHDQIALQLGNRTLTGTLVTGDITTT